MADKIKAARARAQAGGPNKKKKEDRASWFENHVIVMSCDDDKDKEEKLAQALKARVAAGYSGG